jgi:flagellar biosynthesis protein FlhA
VRARLAVVAGGGASRRARLVRAGALCVAVVAGLVLVFGALPPWGLDLLLSAHLGASIWLLLRTLAARAPEAFAPLPLWFLAGVLGRLALNIASTRLILVDGEAGELIAAFSGPLIADSAAVGLSMFCALIALQVIVITRGGERMAEVAARFSLDAMPGQQLALDADQRGGALTPTQAQAARARLIAESKLYGALDGTLKLIRGDAWMGLVILLIDLFGGLAVGALERSQGFGDALRQYGALTLGDGLVHQASGLLLSLGAGLMVLRMSGAEAPEGARAADHDTNRDADQHQDRPLWVAAGALALLSVLPALPAWPLLTASAAAALWAFGSGWWVRSWGASAGRAPAAEGAEGSAEVPAEVPEVAGGPTPSPRALSEAPLTSPLPPAISMAWSGAAHLVALRDQVDARWRAICDHAGVPLPRITWERDAALADRVLLKLDGMAVSEGDLSQLLSRDGAPLRQLLPDVLSMQMAQALLDRWRAREPLLVAALMPGHLSLQRLTALLRRLLRDGVSLQPMRPLLEAVLAAPAAATLDALHATARLALGPQFADLVRSSQAPVLLIGPHICDALLRAFLPSASDHLPPRLSLPPDISLEVIDAIDAALSDHAADPQDAAWVCVVSSLGARPPMQALLRAKGILCPVIALDEIAAFDTSPPLLASAIPIDIGSWHPSRA